MKSIVKTDNSLKMEPIFKKFMKSLIEEDCCHRNIKYRYNNIVSLIGLFKARNKQSFTEVGLPHFYKFIKEFFKRKQYKPSTVCKYIYDVKKFIVFLVKSKTISIKYLKKFNNSLKKYLKKCQKRIVVKRIKIWFNFILSVTSETIQLFTLTCHYNSWHVILTLITRAHKMIN